MHHRSTSPIGFDLGLRTSQTNGPRADGALSAIMVSSFYQSVLSRTLPRGKHARPAGVTPRTVR